MLAPFLQTDGLPRGMLSAGIIITLAIALLLSAVFHYRRARVPAQARVLKWSGCEIDLRKCVIRESQAASGSQWGVAIAVVTGFSVTLYHFLNTLLPKQGMIVLGVVIGVAMGLWLCLWLLGRALGQAWRLRQIEKRDNVRFVTDRMEWLTQERQRSMIGRWWARRVS